METSQRVAMTANPAAFIQWPPVIAGGLAATALSFILLTFGAAIGLSVASTSPTWRETSAALALLSGLYLILQALFSFAMGGYLAGRTRSPSTAGQPSDVE